MQYALPVFKVQGLAYRQSGTAPGAYALNTHHSHPLRLSATVQTSVVRSFSELRITGGGMTYLATLQPGKWYIIGTCSHCTARMPLFEDLSEGKSKLVGTFVTRCPACDM